MSVKLLYVKSNTSSVGQAPKPLGNSFNLLILKKEGRPTKYYKYKFIFFTLDILLFQKNTRSYSGAYKARSLTHSLEILILVDCISLVEESEKEEKRS